MFNRLGLFGTQGFRQIGQMPLKRWDRDQGLRAYRKKRQQE
jgi:hypothetical protein